MSIGLFVAIFMIMTQWYGILSWLSGSIRDMVTEWGILTSYEKLLKESMGVKSERSSNEVPHDLMDGVYIFKVTFKIKGRPSPILENVTLKFQKGEKVAIIGTVGSGKSTLLKIIARLIQPTDGEVFIGGNALSKMTLKKSRELVGYVQQQSVLFNRSIYENISYGNNASRVHVEEMLTSLGIHDAFSNLKHGLDTSVGKNGSALSGGQRQLVQLMRIILNNPDVIILDEVTASLDQETKEKLFKVLEVATKGKTVVMVTHDEHLMAQADRLVEMKDGRIVNHHVAPPGAIKDIRAADKNISHNVNIKIQGNVQGRYLS